MSEGWSYFLDFQGEEFELEAEELVIGRSRSCQISISDPSVSRRHALVRPGGGRIAVRDLGSSNGTFIGGDRIEEGELGDGDTLALGDAELGVRVLQESIYQTVQMTVPDEAKLGEPPEKPGEATVFLQEASVRLADEAIEHEVIEAPEIRPPAGAHVAPPPATPESPFAAALEPSEPVEVELPESAEVAPPVEPVEVAPPPEPAEVAPPSEPVEVAPPPAPAEDAPPPEPVEVAPPPAPVEVAPPHEAAAPTAPVPIVTEPAPPANPLLDTAATQPPAGERRQTPSDLLPSLDGFDVTMGPEMLEALNLERPEQEAPAAAAETATGAVNPYQRPTLPVAGFGVRLAATLVDWAWMIALGWLAPRLAGPLAGALIASGVSLLVILYGWAVWGSSPGKRVFGLTIATGRGAAAGIGFPRALLRLLAYVLSALPLGIGFLMILFSDARRGLHDLIAGTYVRRQR